jgi:tryptophan-rich sensory protein
MTLAPSVRKSPIRPAAVLLGLFVACYGVAALRASITAPSLSTWYATLAKPNFTPPDWLFAPIWTALYGLMAIAAWLVWRTPKHGPDAEFRRSGLILFAVQLSLNALWTLVFFQFHQVMPAFVIVLCLWTAIFFITLNFWNVERFAAGLMISYLLWMTYVTALNFEIFRLN